MAFNKSKKVNMNTHWLDRNNLFGYSIGDIVWSFILILFLFITTYKVGEMLFADKYVKQYYLSGGESGNWTIKVDIENCADDIIKISGMTYEQALIYVSELNKELVLHKRLK